MPLSNYLPSSRFCPSCETEQPIENYTIRKNGKVVAWCRPCSAQKTASYRQRHHDRYLQLKREARRRNPLQVQLESKRRYAKDPEGEKQRYKKYYVSHRAKIVENTRRRRARLLATKTFRITQREWNRLCQRFDWACAYCGCKTVLTMDHVVPLIRGGSHGIGNILPACQPCNSSKNKKFLVEWRRVCP